MKKLKILAIMLGLFVGSWICLASLSYYVIHQFALKEAKKQSHIDKELFALFMSDIKEVHEEPIFEHKKGTKDAASYLQNYISRSDWSDDWSKSPSKKSLEAFKDEISLELNDRQSIEKILIHPKFADLDPSWMEALRHFDQWSYYDQKNIGEVLENIESISGFYKTSKLLSLPSPKLHEMSDWLKIYFLKSYQKGQPLAGLSMYRKIAQLLFNQNMLVSSMTALNHLKKEHFFVDTLEISGWSLIKKEKIETLRRVYWGTADVLYGIAAKSSVLSEVQPYLLPQNGVCIGLSEMVFGGLPGLIDYLESQFPFEVDLKALVGSNKSHLFKLMDECGMQDFKKLFFLSKKRLFMWVNLDEFSTRYQGNFIFRGFFPIGFYESNIVFGPLVFDLAQLPYIRKIFGLILYSLAKPSFLESVYKKHKT